MNQEIKTTAPSKNAFQSMGVLQNCSLKKWISEHGCTSKLLPEKVHFRTLVHIKTSPLKNAKCISEDGCLKIPTDDY